MACATPVGPTWEPFGQSAPVPFSSTLWLQNLKPLPESVICFGATIFSVDAVCVVAVFLTVSTSLTAFGFFFVPALVGLTFTVTLDVGAWALATLVLRTAAATPA